MYITRKFIKENYSELCQAFGTKFTLGMARALRDNENKVKKLRKRNETKARKISCKFTDEGQFKTQIK